MNQTLITAVCSVCFLARFSYALARNPVLPLFALYFGAGPEAIGLAVGISTVTGIFFKLPTGALSDVIGRRRAMLAGDDSALKARFERFRNFLRAYRDSLADMATLEQCDHSGAPVGTPWFRAKTASPQKRVCEMASNLNTLGRGRFETLESRVNDIMATPRQAEPLPRPAEAITRPLGTVLADDFATVGAKPTNLGIMGSRLGLLTRMASPSAARASSVSSKPMG